MAMPPLPAAAPGPAAGADPTMSGAALADDMGAGDDDDDDDVILTVCKDPDGGFTLYKGDEPEDDEEGDDAGAPTAPGGTPAPGGADADEDEDEGQHFDTAPELLRGIMQMLESDSGAEEAFAGGFKGDKEMPASKPPGM